MAITISGENNNDRILASDGVIDQLSGINIAGIVTATTFYGNLIGNVTGNVTGNVNSTSPLLLQTGGSERFRITGNNELGIAGANYGSAGQVLTSGGSGSAVTWSAIPSQVSIANNADNRVITGGSGINLAAESSFTYNAGSLIVSNASGNVTQQLNATGGDAKIVLDNSGNGNYSGIDFERERSTGAGVNGGSIFMLSDTSSNDAYLYLQAQSASAQAPVTSALSNDNGVRLILKGGDGIFSVETGSTEKLNIKSNGQLAFGGVSNNDDYDTNARNILLANESGNFGITIRSGGSDPYAMIHFADGTSDASEFRAGRIFYQHSANSMIFATANVEKLRIDSSGQITNTGIATSFVTTTFAANFAKLDLRGTNIANSNHYILSYGEGHANDHEFHMVNTLGDLVFRTGSSGQTQRVRINSLGEMSIGGQHASYAYDPNDYGNPSLLIAGDDNADILTLMNDDPSPNNGDYASLGFRVAGQSTGSYAKAAIIAERNGGYNAIDLLFCCGTDADATRTTTSHEKVRITSGGRVGIGKDNPIAQLHLKGSGDSHAGLNVHASIEDTTSMAANVGGLQVYEGTYISGSSAAAVFSAIQGAKENATSSNYAGYLRFLTRAHGSLPAERVRITSTGLMGVNTTNPQTTLNVIGSISAGRNVARELGTIINISSNHNAARSGGNVISGGKNYELGSQDWLAAGGSRVNANLTIDLGTAISCDRFVIYNQNEYDHSNREVKNFTLEGSNDNSSWTTVLDDDCGCSHGHEPNPGFSFRIPAGNVYGVDDNEGLSYRYWRFTMKTFHGSDSYGGVTELELYQTGTSTNGEYVGSEITTSSLSAGDVHTERLDGLKMITSSKSLNIHTGEDASDTWEITERGIITNGSYQDKSTIRHKGGVMAVSSGYNTGDLFIRIDNIYNLPGNAWWVFGVLILSNEIQGGQGGGHHYVTSLQIMGLSQWSSVSKQDIVGSMTVSMSNYGSNFCELFVNVNDSSRGPCTVICNGGTFDPPRISFH